MIMRSNSDVVAEKCYGCGQYISVIKYMSVEWSK